MKKLPFVCAGLFLLFSTTVFAEEHAIAALKHAHEALANGKAGQTPLLLEHAKAALEDTLSASLVATGVQKHQLDEGARELHEAIDHATMGHVGAATAHAEAAVIHINRANKEQ